ncbi:MAG: hypothetical protein QXR45_16100 [Candidatus Bathyarchaeia archaeon]
MGRRRRSRCEARNPEEHDGEAGAPKQEIGLDAVESGGYHADIGKQGESLEKLIVTAEESVVPPPANRGVLPTIEVKKIWKIASSLTGFLSLQKYTLHRRSSSF